MKSISVKLDKRSYPIIVGRKAVQRLPELFKKQKDISTLFVFYDAGLYALYGKPLSKQIQKLPINVVELVLPSGERSKSESELRKIHDFLLSHQIARNDFILACGGGVTSDLAGYAAATVLRGVRWGIVTTTLLGMVDAAIGGKTSINHKEGKNLLGAFHQPTFVIADIDHLMTLSKRELVAGLGEVVKYAGLLGRPILSVLDDYLNENRLYDEIRLEKLVRLSAAYKAQIVTKDERESGLRMLLNFGHTFAHGIEASLGYGRLLHGEAVVLGVLAATELSRLYFNSQPADFDEFIETSVRVIKHLPQRRIDLTDVRRSMLLDKKRSGKKLKFVLLRKPGAPIITTGIKEDAVTEALQSMYQTYQREAGNA